MGRAFSADFSAVRVHTGPAAHHVASTLQAHALTTGSDILFRAGAYRPGTPSGDRLLAHELAHVVQQGQGLVRASLDRGPTDPLERAADRAAEVASSSGDGEAYGAAVAAGRGERAPALSRQVAPAMSLLAHELAPMVPQSGGGRYRGDRHDEAGARSLMPARSSETPIQRKGFESTLEICRRVRESRNFEVSEGGLRVVLIVDPLPESVPNCGNFKFWVTLTRSRDLWPDDELATCGASTEASIAESQSSGARSGGARSFSFANLTSGTYYLTFSRAFDHPYCCLSGDVLVFDEPVAGDSEGCIRDKDPTALDIVHGALDLAGFIPVLGAIPDGINAGIYALEGDWVNAGLSAVAMVPAWGDGVKLGAIAGKSAIKVTDKAAIRLGEEGIAKGLKEVKAASKAEKAALETSEEAAKVVKAEKEVAEGAAKAEKEVAGDAATREALQSGSVKAKFKELASVCDLGSINCRFRLPDQVVKEAGAYPKAAAVPNPVGPFYVRRSILSGVRRGTEHLRNFCRQNRKLWPDFDAALAAAEKKGLDWPTTGGVPWEVHHVKPVFMGGDNAIANLFPLPKRIHQEYTTWWNKVHTAFKRRFTDKEWGMIYGDKIDVPGSAVPQKRVR